MKVFDNYVIHSCMSVGHDLSRNDNGNYAMTRDYVEQCPDEEAEFWTLYGHIDGEGVEAIGDFASREDAEAMYHRITGQAFGSHEENAARVRLMRGAAGLVVALQGVVRICEAVRLTVGLGKNQLERIERAKDAIAQTAGRAA